MPQKKKPVPPVDERLKVGSADEIRQRLSEFVKVRFAGNWTHFADTIGIRAPTVEEWKEAKHGWPSFKHLWKLAEHGLSINWLITGQLPMLASYGDTTTDAGKLLALLRPYAQQMTGVGEFTARQAFGHLLIELGVEGMLWKAAEPFVQRYRDVERDVQREDEADRLRAWLYDEIGLLSKRVEVGDGAGIRMALDEMASRIEASIPEWLRRNEAARLEQRAIIGRQVELAEEARRRGWQPYAMTTAVEVAEQVQAVKAALKEVTRRLVQADPDVVRRLSALERTLVELEDGIAAMQSTAKESEGR